MLVLEALNILKNSLTEAGDYQANVEKMRKLNDGTRGFNGASTSPEQLRLKRQVCIDKGFWRALSIVEDEMIKKGLISQKTVPPTAQPAAQPQPAPYVQPQPTPAEIFLNDFTTKESPKGFVIPTGESDWQAVVEAKKTGDIQSVLKVSGGPNLGVYFLIRRFVIAALLGYADIKDAVKQVLVDKGFNGQIIKLAIDHIIANKDKFKDLLDKYKAMKVESLTEDLDSEQRLYNTIKKIEDKYQDGKVKIGDLIHEIDWEDAVGYFGRNLAALKNAGKIEVVYKDGDYWNGYCKIVENLQEDAEETESEFDKYIPTGDDFRKVYEAKKDFELNGDDCNLAHNPYRLPSLLLKPDDDSPIIRRFIASALLKWDLFTEQLKAKITSKLKKNKDDISTIVKMVLAKKSRFVNDFIKYNDLVQKIKKEAIGNPEAEIDAILKNIVNTFNEDLDPLSVLAFNIGNKSGIYLDPVTQKRRKAAEKAIYGKEADISDKKAVANDVKKFFSKKEISDELSLEEDLKETMNLTENDFHTADALFIKEHINDPKAILDNCMAALGTIKHAIIALILCAILRAPEETKKAVSDFLTINCGIAPQEMKEIIVGCAADTEIKARLQDILKEIKDLESAESQNTQAQSAATGTNSSGTNAGVMIGGGTPSTGFCRLVIYDVGYQPPARRHLYISKKVGGVYTVTVGGSQLSPSHDWWDEPLFDSVQQAQNFIANVDQINIKTKTNTKNFKYSITSKPIDMGYGQYKTQIANLSDAVLVDTVCGPAYIQRRNPKCVESLQEDAEKVEEDVEKHDKLNQKIFDNNHLKPEVREKCLEIVDEFAKKFEDVDVAFKIKDIILTGSNASYNYTKDSDIDIHIIADTSELEDPNKLYPLIYDAYKSIFNSKMEISIYGIPVEIYVETEDTPAVSNGIYSIKNDNWVKEPVETIIPEIDWDEFMKAFDPWEKEYKKIVKETEGEKSIDETPIDEFITKLYELRQQGLQNGGEYSFENLIFKELRNRGHLDRLKDLKNKIIANRLSLKSLDEAYLDDEHLFFDYKTAEIADDEYIDTKKGSNFSAQDLLDGSSDKAYENLESKIEQVTPKQYFAMCGRIQHQPAEELISQVKDDKDKLEHLVQVIKVYNKKFPTPYVNFVPNTEPEGQEGKHRMYVLGELFGWDTPFPVQVIRAKK